MRSVKLGIVAATLLLGTTALTTPAFATGSNHCTHNCTPTPPPPPPPPPPQPPKGGDIDIDNHNTAIGVGVGIGGEGGKGGNGYGGNATGGNATGGNATGGNATGGNATNSNTNSANNTNINTPVAYGGKGGDAEVKNSGNSEIKNSGNSYVHNDNENKQHQSQNQNQNQSQHQSIKDSGNSYNENDNSNSNNASQTVNTYNERAPVNTAYAAPLAVGEDTCMGSSSIGAQAVSFGLSIGTTWQDDNCRRLKNSRQLVSLGYHRAATSLMCVDEDVRQAMIMAGTPCPNGEVVAVIAPPPAREYVPMAPVNDRPVRRKHRRHAAPLPPK